MAWLQSSGNAAAERRSRRPSTRRNSVKRQPGIERLEGRQLLSGNEPQQSEVILADDAPGAIELIARVEPWRPCEIMDVSHTPAAIPSRPVAPSPESFRARPVWVDQLVDRLVSQSVDRWRGVFGQPVHRSWGWCGMFRGCVFVSYVGLPLLERPASSVAVMDHADVVKSAGGLHYLLGSNRLSIVKGLGAGKPHLVSQVGLGDIGRPIGMYLTSGRVTIVSTSSGTGGREGSVTVVDVSHPAAPRVVSRIAFDGEVVTSQLSGGQLRLVLRHETKLGALAQWLDGQSPAVECQEGTPPPPVEHAWAQDGAMVDGRTTLWRCGLGCSPSIGHFESEVSFANRLRQELLARIDRAFSVPCVRHFDAAGNVSSERPLVALEAIGELATSALERIGAGQFDWWNDTRGDFTSVTAIDISPGTPAVGASICIAQPGNLIAHYTPDSLYLMSSSWLGTEITKIEFGQGHDGLPTTVVAARGRVNGTVINPFAADEREGKLRLVVDQASWRGGGVAVVILDSQGDSLVEVGRLDGLAVGEDLHAVRFAGDQVYLVTLLTVDPLFVVDVSTPTAPRLLGELKIPGVAEHIEVLDGGYLITLGRDMAAGQWQREFTDMQVSLFDVRDPTRPIRVDYHSFSGGWRTRSVVTGLPGVHADGDPLALGVFGAVGIVTVPVERRGGSQALEVLRFDPATGLEWVGVIDHDAYVTRTLQIDDRLIVISDSEVSVHDIADPTVVVDVVRLDGSDGDLPGPEEWTLPTDESTGHDRASDPTIVEVEPSQPNGDNHADDDTSPFPMTDEDVGLPIPDQGIRWTLPRDTLTFDLNDRPLGRDRVVFSNAPLPSTAFAWLAAQGDQATQEDLADKPRRRGGQSVRGG